MDCLTLTGEIMLAGSIFAGLIGFGTEALATRLGYRPTNYFAKWASAREAHQLQATAC